MKHGVFINQTKANCSIYESGLLIKDILTENTTEYKLDYFETNDYLNGYIMYPYDFHIINYHPHTLKIHQALINKLPHKVAIVVEVSPTDYIPFTPDWFDGYAIIDPTKKRMGKFFPLPRPILRCPTKPLLNKDKFVLGSFGLFSYSFASEKRFDEIIKNANESGKECIVRINLPTADYTYTPLSKIVDYTTKLKLMAKSNVEVIITHDYMERDKLVGWLSEHNINCFPYYRERPGLSAVTDQAISARRGIMVNECNTFRHLHKYISYYPKEDYYSLSKSTLKGVNQMYEDWSPTNFTTQFNNMLRELRFI
jgi:hypothetical protein